MGNRAITLLLTWLLISTVVLLSARSANLRASAEQASASTSQGLAGQMPAGFDADVARVVAELDQIEADTLRLADKTTLARQGQATHWGS